MADTFGQDLVGLLPNLRRYAVSLCRSPDRADDLVQRTCEKALASRAFFKPGTRLDAWLFRILRNTWIDELRRERVQGTRIDIDDAQDLPGTDGPSRAEDRLALSAAGAAIARLPDEQREVLVLVCVEELSYRETADVLQLPIGTVMSRLARARQKLADQLGINPSDERSSSNRKPR